MLTRRSKYVEWPLSELHAAMRNDKAVQAAVLNILYRELARKVAGHAAAQAPNVMMGEGNIQNVRAGNVHKPRLTPFRTRGQPLHGGAVVRRKPPPPPVSSRRCI